MKYWEWDLLFNTIDFVERCIPDHPQTTKDEVVDKVYQQAHKTLRLFHDRPHERRGKALHQRTDRNQHLQNDDA